MTEEAKPNIFLAATKKTQCLLHCGVCLLAACSRGWAQHCGMMTFTPECLSFAFSPNPEMLSLHWEEEQRE